MVDQELPGYSGPILKGFIGGGSLGVVLGAMLGYLAHATGFDVPISSLSIWAMVAGALAAVQGSTHLGLLTHRKRQAIIHGVDLDNHDHDHDHAE